MSEATTLTHSALVKPSFVKRLVSRRRREAGITTAEYAVGSAGGVTLIIALFKLLTSDWFIGLVKHLIELAFGGFGL